MGELTPSGPHQHAAQSGTLLVWRENWHVFSPPPLSRIAIYFTDFARLPQIRQNLVWAAPRHPALVATISRSMRRAGSRGRNPTRRRGTLWLTGPGVWTDELQRGGWLRQPTTMVVGREIGVTMFQHSGSGSWKGGIFKNAWTERTLVLVGVALCVLGAVSRTRVPVFRSEATSV